MENEFFDAGIEETMSKIKIKLDERKVIDKELIKLKSELKRKESAKAIYFGEKKKSKSKKPENEEKMDDSEQE
jgi:hypothetical protein